MNYNRVAFRYAKALLLSCNGDNNKLETIFNDMSYVNKTFDDSEELKLFIDSKVIKDSDKLATLNEIFKSLCDLSKNLIKLLMKNRRIDLFDDVSKSFTVLYNDHAGNQEVILTTASKVESNKLKEIENKVKQLTSKNVNLTNHIDENIVGGFVLRVGDLQYNASLKDQLKKLEQEFLNISIQ
jgi:F-type H+-transporting ATPase subunit delta